MADDRVRVVGRVDEEDRSAAVSDNLGDSLGVLVDYEDSQLILLACSIETNRGEWCAVAAHAAHVFADCAKMFADWAQDELGCILRLIMVVEADDLLANGADLTDNLILISEGDSSTKMESDAGCSTIAFVLNVETLTSDTSAISGA